MSKHHQNNGLTNKELVNAVLSLEIPFSEKRDSQLLLSAHAHDGKLKVGNSIYQPGLRLAIFAFLEGVNCEGIREMDYICIDCICIDNGTEERLLSKALGDCIAIRTEISDGERFLLLTDKEGFVFKLRTEQEIEKEIKEMISTDFSSIGEERTVIRIGIKELTEGLSKVSSARGENNYMDNLFGVFLNSIRKELVATDRKRMHIFSLPMQVDGIPDKFLIPGSIIKPILLLGKKEDGEIKITLRKDLDRHNRYNLVELKGNQFQVLFKETVFHKFPNYEKVIPNNSPIKWTVEKEALKKILDIMYSFKGADGIVEVTIKKDKTDISMRPIREEINKSIPSTLEGCEEFRFGFQLLYVLDIISSLEEDYVTFEIRDKDKAILVKEKDFKGLFMPWLFDDE